MVYKIVAVVQNVVRLVASDIIDALGERLVGVKRFPTSDSFTGLSLVTIVILKLTISSDKRVHCAKVIAVVQRVSTAFGLDGDAQPARLVMEEVGIVGGRQGLKELGHRL